MRRPVQKRSKTSRREILDAAALVFAEHGYNQATVEAIVERSGLSKGAIYHFFSSKAEVAEAVVHEGFTMEAAEPQVESQQPQLYTQRVVDASIALAALTPVVPIVKAAARLATNPDHPRFFGALWSAYIPGVRDLLTEAKRRGELRAGVDPGLSAEMWVADYVGVDLKFRLSYDQLPTRIAEMNEWVAHGIATSHTFEELDLSVDRGFQLARRSSAAAAYLDALEASRRACALPEAAVDQPGRASDELKHLGAVLRAWEG